MKQIELTQGKYALVDDEDYEYLSQWEWCYNKGYAYRIGGVLMHRVINKTPNGMFTDHINRNGLDNRKDNLRTCTSRQNQGNTNIRKDNKSGFKGVHWHKSGKGWTANIKDHGKRLYLGLFTAPEDASMAYQKEAEKVFKQFATNKEEK